MGGAIPAGGGSGGGFPLAGLPLAVGRRPIAQRGRDQTRRGPADHDDNRLAYGGGCWTAGCFSDSACLCFRLPSLSPGNRFRPRRECDTLGLSEDGHDCISARSTRQYP